MADGIFCRRAVTSHRRSPPSVERVGRTCSWRLRRRRSYGCGVYRPSTGGWSILPSSGATASGLELMITRARSRVPSDTTATARPTPRSTTARPVSGASSVRRSFGSAWTATLGGQSDVPVRVITTATAWPIGRVSAFERRRHDLPSTSGYTTTVTVNSELPMPRGAADSTAMVEPTSHCSARQSVRGTSLPREEFHGPVVIRRPRMRGAAPG